MLDDFVDGVRVQVTRLTVHNASLTFDAGHVHLIGEVEANPRHLRPCLGCGGSDAFDTYVVHDELWLSTGWGKRDGVCHLACFEKKIGRRVTLMDLKDVPLNNMLKHVLS